MTQIVFPLDPSFSPITLPSEDDWVMPGVRWGSVAEPFTPAFWAALVHQSVGRRPQFRLGASLLEETAACLLGGYGIRSEVGLAAYRRLRERGLLRIDVEAAQILTSLSEPMQPSYGATVRYRFARTKALALAQTLNAFAQRPRLHNALELRQWLITLPGIGLKTASWVVRNHLDSDEVAILDVHLMRAGYVMGLFPNNVKLPRDYLCLEAKFLAFAKHLGVRASHLDGCIWAQMKRAGAVAHIAAANLPNATKGQRRPSHMRAKSNSSEKQLALL